MDDKKKQEIPNSNDSGQPQLHIQPGTKVIQPSAALLEELKNQKNEENSQPASQQTIVNEKIEAESAPIKSPEEKNSAPDSRQNPNLSKSIYPEATRDVDVSAQNAGPADMRDSSRDKVLIGPKRIFVIRLVTGFLLLSELAALYIQISIWRVLHSASNIASLIVILVVVMLLAGMMLLNDKARTIYVFLAVATLLITIFSLLSLYVSTHKSSVSKSSQQQLSRQQIDYSIDATEQNNQYTPEQKQLIIKNLKNQPGYANSGTKLKAKRYFTDLYIAILAIGPIVFYTRPKIKEAFT